MERPRIGPDDPRYLAAVLPLALVALTAHLGLAPAYLEEPRRALVAMELLFRGDFVVPTQLGLPYVNKPPLFNWVLIGLSRLAGGFPEVLGRLVSVASLLGMAAVTAALARRDLGARAAAAAAGFTLVGADLLFYFSTTGEIDLFYGLLHWAGFAALYAGDREDASPARRWTLAYLLPWALAAAGTLTKGFPSPLFLGLTYLGWFGLRRRWRALFHPAQFAGAALYAAAVGGYFAAYAARADLPMYLEGLFGQSSQRTVAEHGTADLLRHLVAFPLDTLENLLPATLALPLLVAALGRPAFRGQRLLRFCALVLAANVWVYWISPGTRARYVYMLYPLLLVPLSAAWYAVGEGPSAEGRARAWARALRRLAGGIGWALVPLLAAAPFALRAADPEAFEAARRWIPHPAVWIGAAAAWAGVRATAFRRLDGPARFILLALVARLAFDGAVLPLRAVSGEAAALRTEALALAEATAGQPLRLHGLRNAGNFPLAVAYVLERERGEVLGCDREPVPGTWYLAEPAAFPAEGWTAGRGFTWKGFAFRLYRPADGGAEADGGP